MIPVFKSVKKKIRQRDIKLFIVSLLWRFPLDGCLAFKSTISPTRGTGIEILRLILLMFSMVEKTTTGPAIRHGKVVAGSSSGHEEWHGVAILFGLQTVRFQLLLVQKEAGE
jgi:hypothetical protein